MSRDFLAISFLIELNWAVLKNCISVDHTRQLRLNIIALHLDSNHNQVVRLPHQASGENSRFRDTCQSFFSISEEI